MKKTENNEMVNSVKKDTLIKINIREMKGITLIALVITIIILLILAGISILALGGENGLFTRAKQAKNNTLDAQKAENQALTGYENKIDEVLGNSGGTTVEIGKTNSSKNRALSDATTGYTYKNPVIPQGFKAVDTDNAKWEYTDAEKTTVKGWNEGLVIEDVYNQNQFVWVPCTISATTDTVAYVKDFSLPSNYDATSSNTYDATDSTIVDTVTYKAIPVTESTQIGTYGGFYVARYEAGLPTETTSQSDTLNNVYTSIPVSKLGSKVWNYVDFTHSYVAANKMISDTTKYGNNKSGLITGTQWDTIMAWYKKEGIGVEASTQNWGTYRNLTYSGNGMHFTYDSSASTWKTGSFSHTGTTTSLSSTSPSFCHASGLNSNGIKKNIADLGGNLYEWVAEAYDSNNRVLRSGGCVNNSLSDSPAGIRGTIDANYTECDVGFRSVLYIQ